MNVVFAGFVGLVVGVVVGSHMKNKSTACDFCGYLDDETKELYETHELNKLLEENG